MSYTTSRAALQGVPTTPDITVVSFHAFDDQQRQPRPFDETEIPVHALRPLIAFLDVKERDQPAVEGLRHQARHDRSCVSLP